MDVFQCPECSLKFRYSSELDQHIALDHPDFRAELEDDALREARAERKKKRDLKQI